jgi:type VI secretion system protein ImpA
MTTIDVEQLLTPASEEDPCGPNLEYDPAYTELERLAQSTPEQQVGDSIIPAEEPNWKQVGIHCRELLGRTRDLRLLVLLAASQLETEGLPGFEAALRLTSETLKRYWDGVHPKLDPDDGNDPTERINILASLSPEPGAFGDEMQILRRIQSVPIVESRAVGRFSVRDIKIASGEIAAPSGGGEGEEGEGETPGMATINAAFEDTSIDELQARAALAQSALDQAREIDQFLTETLGAGTAPSFASLQQALGEVHGALQEQLKRRGVTSGATDEGEAEEGGDGGGGDGGGGGGGGGDGGARLRGEVRSREDVVLALEKLCKYYDTYEPSSPIPLLLRRAQRLATKSFMEIVQDLSPGSMGDLSAIFGQSPPGDSAE